MKVHVGWFIGTIIFFLEFDCRVKPFIPFVCSLFSLLILLLLSLLKKEFKKKKNALKDELKMYPRISYKFAFDMAML